VSPKHAYAQRVKRADLGRLAAFAFASQEFHRALLHLARGLVGERHGQDAVGSDAALDQARDAVGDDPRLARAGTGEHEQWPRECADRLLLCWVQTWIRHGARGRAPSIDFGKESSLMSHPPITSSPANIG